MAHLAQVVKRIADKKGISLGSVSSSELRNIERKLEKKEIEIEQSIADLQGIEKIRLGFDRKDYERIKREMK